MDDKEIKCDELGRPRLEQFSEEGFVDCVFRIVDVVSDEARHRLRLVASYNSVVVGFSAVVRRGIRGGFSADMKLVPEHVYRSAVEFMRSGAESDDLVTALAGLYGQPVRKPRMVDAISFTAIALHQDDVDMDTQPIRIKLFGRDSDAEIERDEYFESFFNLDLRCGFAFWNEKDPDYREPLIHGLTIAG